MPDSSPLSKYFRPAAAPTLDENYYGAALLSRLTVDPVATPVAHALYDFLERLQKGLGDEAGGAGWHVEEARPNFGFGDDARASGVPTPYLLIPAFSGDPSSGVHSLGSLVAVRKIELERPGPAHPFIPGRPAKPYRDATSRVETAHGRPVLSDVPTPFEAGAFDADFIWVTRDPVDVLLLRKVGIHAVSLAAPSDTLGSAAGLLELVEIGALTRRVHPRGTVVVVDPGTPLGDARAGLLCGLFENVWEALPEDRPPENGDVLTGAHLAGSIRVGTEHGWGPDQIRDVLMASVSNLGVLRQVPPVLLPSDSEENVGGWGPRKPLALVTAGDLSAKGDTTPWLVKPFVAARAITDLHGPAKAGKTTFLLSLAGALAQGAEFLGEPCRRARPVVYVSEQTEGTIRQSAERAGGLVDGVHFLTLEATFGRPFGEIVAFVRRECRRLGAGLVVFDTLGSIAGLVGETDNMAGTARDVYRQLRGFSVDGVAVLVVRHSRKARGGIAETAAGSVAFSGEADQLVRFTKPSETLELRRVEIVGRIGDSATFNVEMTDAGWVKGPDKNDGERVADGLVRGSTRPTAKDAVVKVLAAMGPTAATQAEIVAEIVKRSKSDGGRAYKDGAIYRALQALLKDGIVDKDDRRPLRYHPRATPIHSSPEGGENE